MTFIPCQYALDLVKEIKRTNTIPLFSDENIRHVSEEILALVQANEEILNAPSFNENDSTHVATISVNHEIIERNKRCALAYLNTRKDRIANIRWEIGSISIPSQIATNLNTDEKIFFNEYCDNLSEYMSKVGLDISANRQPPKNVYTSVRVLEECGTIMTDTGSIYLEKNTCHNLKRSDVEHLIRQGYLQELDS